MVRLETEGIDERRIRSGELAVQASRVVQKYVTNETREERSALYRFLFFAEYSSACTVSFTARKLFFSESTLAIAIGDIGMRRLDDLACFTVLYESLSAAFVSKVDCVLWIMVAHMLVRPGLIEHLRNEVCTKRTTPTKENISYVIGALARCLLRVYPKRSLGSYFYRLAHLSA